MAEDTPDDLVHELLMLAHFGDQPLSRPILGEADTVRGFVREDLLAYYNHMYRPENAVLAVAGHYDWDELLALIEKELGDWAPGGTPQNFRSTPATPSVIRREKDIEQLHLCLGYQGVAQDSPWLYPLSITNSVFGGAMSSRLFQKIREERGMAYTVYSYPSSYRDCGLMAVYAGTSVENVPEVLRLIREEARLLIEQGLTQEEFEQAREQLKGGYILGLESTSSRMNALGRRKLLMNDTQTESQVIEKIDAITYDQVMEITRQVLGAPTALALVGKGAQTVGIG